MNVAQWVGMTIDGRYVVDRVLGEGGMGVVLRAHHQFTGANVAVKMIRPELEMTPEIQHRFLAEARAANAIGHDRIVQVLDAGKAADGSLYLVMELLEGQSLRVAMLTRPFGVDEVRRILRDLLEVLAVAHSKGFVHRDLKPDNVFLEGPTASVKLLDFGIAKVLGASTGHVRTVAGTTLGTPAYMAPEQLRDASSVDPRADLWAVGVMVYELISGRLPYQGSMHDMLVAIASRAPDPIRAYIPGVSPSLEVFFTRALARDPRARFGSAAEMASAITMVELPNQGTPSAQPPVHSSPASWVHAPTPVASPVSAVATPAPSVAGAWAAPAAATPTPSAVTPPAAWAPAPVPPGSLVAPATSTRPPRGGSRALRWIALGLGLVMVAGFVTFLVRRSGDASAKSGTATDVWAEPQAGMTGETDPDTETDAESEAEAAAAAAAEAEIARGTAARHASCTASCAAASTCELAPAECVTRCMINDDVYACVSLAGSNCVDSANCFLASQCGRTMVPRGTGTCLGALACADGCKENDKGCECACLVTAAPRHALVLGRVAACIDNCRNDKACIQRACKQVALRCAEQH